MKRALTLTAAAMLGTAVFAGPALAEREERSRGITIATSHVEYSAAPSIVVYVEGLDDIEGIPEPVGNSPTSALVERGDDGRVTAMFANNQFGGTTLGDPLPAPVEPAPAPSTPPPLPPYPSIP